MTFEDQIARRGLSTKDFPRRGQINYYQTLLFTQQEEVPQPPLFFREVTLGGRPPRDEYGDVGRVTHFHVPLFTPSIYREAALSGHQPDKAIKTYGVLNGLTGDPGFRRVFLAERKDTPRYGDTRPESSQESARELLGDSAAADTKDTLPESQKENVLAGLAVFGVSDDRISVKRVRPVFHRDIRYQHRTLRNSPLRNYRALYFLEPTGIGRDQGTYVVGFCTDYWSYIELVTATDENYTQFIM